MLVCNAYAQWLPGSTEINLGGFKLDSHVGQAGIGVYHIGGTQANSLSTNSLPMNNSSINSTPTSAINAQPIVTQPSMIDLTGYARDRLKGNLTGYSNIMYPLAESRGSTASTSTSAGCGCGG